MNMSMTAAVGDITVKMSFNDYKKNKIKMLEREFMMPLTDEEREHMNSLVNAAEVDRYARTIILKRWN